MEKRKSIRGVCDYCGRSSSVATQMFHVPTSDSTHDQCCEVCYRKLQQEAYLTRGINKPTAPKTDPINPSHYRDHPSGVECITITQHENFCIGNAIKYLWRRRKKNVDTEIEDLKKAVWYIQQEIFRLTDGGQQMSKALNPGKQYEPTK